MKYAHGQVRSADSRDLFFLTEHCIKNEPHKHDQNIFLNSDIETQKSITGEAYKLGGFLELTVAQFIHAHCFRSTEFNIIMLLQKYNKL